MLIAKLATGEFARGDNWYRGQTKNPWNTDQGSSGSSAGPASATAAACVAFGIGTETQGSIVSPARRCGLSALRPTFGRVSRYGGMVLSWSMDMRFGDTSFELVTVSCARIDKHRFTRSKKW